MGTHIYIVIILTLSVDPAAWCALVILSYTTEGPCIIYMISIYTPGGYAYIPVYGILYSSTKPVYDENY